MIGSSFRGEKEAEGYAAGGKERILSRIKVDSVQYFTYMIEAPDVTGHIPVSRPLKNTKFTRLLIPTQQDSSSRSGYDRCHSFRPPRHKKKRRRRFSHLLSKERIILCF